jgi:chromosome segregation ATPase
MQDGFELLEEKVRKAADLVKKLRRENKALEDDLTKAKGRLQEAEKRLLAVEKDLQHSGGKAGESEALAAELGALKHEREEVRRRIAKLVEVLEGLDA